MKFKLCLQFLLALLVVFTSFCRGPQTEGASPAQANLNETSGPVTVYLVRHAEKKNVDPTDQDPELTEQGFARAESLRELLQEVEVDAVYVTKYKRTQQTLKPIADERNLPLEVYESNDFGNLKKRLLEKHQGQTVVIAGHSNTLLPLIEALGAKANVSRIQETEYDYIFRIVVNPDKTATVNVNRYGTASN